MTDVDAPDPRWVRSATGRFHRLVHLDPEAEGLKGVHGVYVVWHSGVKPMWVFIGKSKSLADTFHDLGDDQDIMSYEIHGGLFVTWAPIRDEFQDGVVRYLNLNLKPLVRNPALPGADVEPIAVMPPALGTNPARP